MYINLLMNTVHIYKISTYKYFLTTVFETVLETVSTTDKQYEYVGQTEVPDTFEQMSFFVISDITEGDKPIKPQIALINSDNFDSTKEEFENKITEMLKCPDVKLYFFHKTHDVLSNVYCVDACGEGFTLKAVFVKSQNISNLNVDFWSNQLKPKIKNISELHDALETFNDTELDIYLMSLPITTDYRETMRRGGNACIKTIDEYHVPLFGISYNFYDEINILIGNAVEERYVENYEDLRDKKRLVTMQKTTITGKHLENTIKSLKSYTNFKLHVGHLYRWYLDHEMESDTSEN